MIGSEYNTDPFRSTIEPTPAQGEQSRQHEYTVYSQTLEQMQVVQLSLAAMMSPVDRCS
jgi:hypothetical protein